MGEFAHDNGRGVHEHAGHFLVASPVRALDRIQKMDIRAVALTHDGVAQSRLHAALSRRGMGTFGMDQTQTDDIEPGPGRLDGHALTGQPGTQAQQVCIYCFNHVSPLLYTLRK